MELVFGLFVTIAAFLFLIILLMIVRKIANLPNDTIVYQVNILALGAVVFTVLAGFTGIAVWPNFPGLNGDNSNDLVKKTVLILFLAVAAIATAVSVLHAQRQNQGRKSIRLTASAYSLSATSVMIIMTTEFLWS
ncbi:MAG: hypothetical protein AAF683_01655 [Pseudomonadota bacterium]